MSFNPPGGYFYILANHKSGTIYVGSTSNLQDRMFEHKSEVNPNSFTARYNIKRLVYFEPFDTLSEARQRERAVKRYKRMWKIALIEKDNPEWEEIKLSWDD